MKNLKMLWTMLLLLTGAVASAAVTPGYYYIKSYNGYYMTENITEHTLICSGKSTPTNYAQVWYLSGSGTNVTIKNALTNKYVQGQGSFSRQYSTGTNTQNFTLGEASGVYTFQYDPYYIAGLHCDGALNVVEWYTSDEKSKWTIEAVSVNSSDLAAQQAATAEATTSQLTTFFTSTACTELRSTWVNYSDDNLRKAMKDLPTTVQDMALKVKNNAWTTYSGWDKTERTFRIADYKAYSSHTQWASILGLSYVFGRLTNPTGVAVAVGDYLQVYVGSIPSGQSVQLEIVGENQAVGSTYTLHAGMNAILASNSGTCFVQYEVDNTTDGNAPYTPLSNYADVTVHIEGGTVNGYFDLTKGDDNDDWTALQTHLLKGATTVELKTGRQLFHMNIALVTNACPAKMVELLGEWNKILDMEYALMGLEDYDGLWNNLLSATHITGDGYMYATNYGTYYNTTTISDVMSYEKLFAGGALWGPAHENGHVFQKYINMVGQTEVSNNVFSNIAVYNNGHLTSRASNISTTFENMAKGVFWIDRDIWERTHLYFQLYQFFHIQGNDPDFYPQLFKALRSDPMTHTGNTFISASDDYLKFYKKCCQVSGYDLTEFFQAYGFFVVPTLTSYVLNGVTKDAYKIEDYSDYYLTVTQAEIDAAKAAVAAMHLPTANAIFIEDRITAPDATYEGAATGAKKTAFSNEYPIGQSGETGQYDTFDATCSAYGYNVSASGAVVMSGTGAVGFKVYDASGNLIHISNTYNFSLPSEAYDRNGLKSGYVIKAAAGTGTDAVATLDKNIIINEFPKLDMWYSFCSSLRGSRYVKSNGVGAGVTGATSTSIPDEMQWQFVLRDGETESYDIVNRADGSYLNPVADWNTQLTTTDSRPSAGWQLSPAATQGMYIIFSGTTELNQTNISGFPVYSYGFGSDTSDTGCQYTISEVEAIYVPDPTPEPTISDTALEELDGYYISVASEPAANLITGQWYVMFDRGTSPGPHGYLYEDVTTHTLYNTATAPAGWAPNACKYLVRLCDAGSGKFYIQTGYGNYFGQIETSVPVPLIPTQTQRIAIAKIANTSGHFYLQCETGGVVLDANDIRSGNATVVGWGTSIPSTLNGNNDWAFYPVEMVEMVYTRDVEAGSWGMVCVPGGVTSADINGAVIYSIAGKTVDAASNPTSLILKEVETMEAGKPYLFQASDNASQLTLKYSGNLAAQAGSASGLIGTFSDATVATGMYFIYNGYVVQSPADFAIGANSAYINMDAVPSYSGSGGVKTLPISDYATVIKANGLMNGTESPAAIYDLSGRRVSSPTKGLFISNGRKILK